MSDKARIFAVVPAAGMSRRMGKPKLVLPLGATTVIERTLTALRSIPADRQYVVLRDDDILLAQLVRRCGSCLVQPESPPPDMRSSVEAALRAIKIDWQPREDDAWLLLPADSAALHPGVVDVLLAAWRETSEDVLVPQFRDQRGHPAFFRWTLTQRLFELNPKLGVNALRKLPDVTTRLYPVTDESVLGDLDTPEDYTKLLNQLSNQPAETEE